MNTTVDELRKEGSNQQAPSQPLATQQPFSPPTLQPSMQLESAASAQAAQAKAAVEARYVMAMHRPRNWDTVRQVLINECLRPSFAHNKSAYYKKPIGSGVEGLGIRFVEVALRCMTNVLVETNMIAEDDLKEVQRVSVTDLEANLTYFFDVRVSKTVERSKPMDDGSYISVRKNSYGKEVYTIPANDDDLLNKRGALISKALRNLGLRIIPGDLQDDAEATIKKVRLDRAAEDPGAEKKRIIDAFAKINVRVSELISYLGHDIDTCSPAELVDLRGLYGAIRDGEATWKQVMENKTQDSGEGKKPNTETGDTWPKHTEKGYVDAAGELFSDALHTMKDGKPVMNKDDTFRKKRGAKQNAGGGSGVPTLEGLAERMKEAKDQDALDTIYDMRRDLASDQERDALDGVYNSLCQKFNDDDLGME